MAAPSPSAGALKRVTAPARRALVLARALQVIASVATIAPFAALVWLAGNLLVDGQAGSASGTAAIIAIATALVVRAAASQGAFAVAHFADLSLQGSLRSDLAGHLGVLPLGWFAGQPAGAIRKRVQDDVAAIHSFVAHGAVESTAAVATPAVAVAYLLSIDVGLGLAAVAVVPLQLAAQAVMMKGIGDKLAAMNEGLARLSAAVVEVVAGISVVKLYGRPGEAHQNYRTAAAEFGRGYASRVGPLTRRSALVSVLFSAPTVMLAMLGIGLAAMTVGWSGPVEVVAAALVAAMLPPAIQAVLTTGQARREAAAASLSIVSLLDEPGLPEPAEPKQPASSEVRLQDVTFGYEPGQPVVHRVNLTLAPGTVTALVGPSGSGKSTIAGLIARFFDPDQGRVLLGGVDLREAGSTVVHRTVGVVLQDAQLVRLSVADNIRLGRPDATDAEVRRAAAAAQIATEIEALPRGFDSVIGEDARLSGGQQQRVAIARALLGDPPVVVLDEATAYADPQSEAAIQLALSRLLSGRTVVVIAHRLETIVRADQIAVLDAGRIVELGRHEELLHTPGRYAAMWSAGPGRRDEATRHGEVLAR
ncbi:MAG: ABC transporter ATP-binding protein [Propionicimonas sp.]